MMDSPLLSQKGHEHDGFSTPGSKMWNVEWRIGI
jgi:hypothetical protein